MPEKLVRVFDYNQFATSWPHPFYAQLLGGDLESMHMRPVQLAPVSEPCVYEFAGDARFREQYLYEGWTRLVPESEVKS